MKSNQSLIDAFKSVTDNLFDKDNQNRKLDEVRYFEAYLQFLSNSIYYSHFSYVIDGITIKGKYLNEKVTNWANLTVFDKIYDLILKEYIKSRQSTKKIFSIDSQFIRNRSMSAKSIFIGRNKFYKNKRGIKFTVIVDDLGTPFTTSIDNGTKHDSQMLIKECNKLIQLIDTKQNDVNLLADSGYDSIKNKQFLKDNGIQENIKWNKKNTKNPTIIKINTFTKKQKKCIKKE